MGMQGRAAIRAALLLALVIGLGGPWPTDAVAGVAQPETEPVRLAAPTPADPQPDAADLAPGLAVRYYYARLTHIDRLVEWIEMEKGVEGPPLPKVNHAAGIGDVLTSRGSDMVGALITGFIRFDTAGTYTFHVTSNDGVRLTIGGVMMHEDPRIHPDTLSPPLVMPVAAPGWYPIEILYYEKKGTSTLILEWTPPDGPGRQVVPADALAHEAAGEGS